MKAHLLCHSPRTGPGPLSIGVAVCLFAFAVTMLAARPATAQENEGLSPAEMAARAKVAYESKDYETAHQWARVAANQGNARGQNILGLLYLDGLGDVSKDYAEGVKWVRLAAEQGYMPAQFNLGDFYVRGEVVAKDEAEAVKWYRLAAEQGNAGAQGTLGTHCAYGRGVAKDDAEAVKWYRLAAEQGDVFAQSNLGRRYADGLGVAKDDAEAVKWYYRFTPLPSSKTILLARLVASAWSTILPWMRVKTTTPKRVRA